MTPARSTIAGVFSTVLAAAADNRPERSDGFIVLRNRKIPCSIYLVCHEVLMHGNFRGSALDRPQLVSCVHEADKQIKFAL